MATLRRSRQRVVRRARLQSSVGGVYRFSEKLQLPDISIAATGNTAGLLGFSWSSLTNISAFQNMFDLYKLTGVKLTMIPEWSVNQVDSTGTSGGQSTLPMLYIAQNRDGLVPAPTGIADVLNDDGSKIVRLTKPVSFYIKNPKVVIPTYDTQFNPTGYSPWQFNSSSSGLQPWLTTGGNAQKVDQSSLVHYGFRYLIANSNQGGMTLKVFAKYYFMCKEQD